MPLGIIRLQRKEPDPYALYLALVRENPRADDAALLKLLEKEWPHSKLAANMARKRAIGG